MNKVNYIIKENYDLKNKLDSIIVRLKENDVKYQGFKTIQFSLLLSNSLEEISDKSLYYIEEIFNIDKAILFIREDSYDILNNIDKEIKRIKIVDKKSISYTFLQPDIKVCNQNSTVHSSFQMMQEQEECSYILCPVLVGKEIVAAIGLYSKNKNKFSEDHEFDFIKDLVVVVSIGLKKINDLYLFNLNSKKDELTGLYNKYYLEKINEEFFNDYKNNKEVYSIFLLTVSNINKIYNQIGKRKTDDFFKNLGSKLEKILKYNNGTVGRYSENEFYVIAKENEYNGLEAIKDDILNNMNKAIEKIKIEISHVLTIINVSGKFNKLKHNNKAATHSDILFLLNKISEEEKNKISYSGNYSEDYYNKEKEILSNLDELIKDFGQSKSLDKIKDQDVYLELKKKIVEQWVEDIKNTNSSIVEYNPFM